MLATTGTVASGGYERTFEKLSREKGCSGDLMVVSHGSMGFAEAVDGERDYVDPRPQHPGIVQGPSEDHSIHRIDLSLLPAYGFDFSMGRMLYEGTPENPF